MASQSAGALMADTGKGEAAVSEARHSSTIEAREGAAILAESATAINEPTAKSAAAAPLGTHAPSLAASAPATPAPVQDKVVGKKPRLAYRRDAYRDGRREGAYQDGGRRFGDWAYTDRW